jgi:hypothetical protein
MDGTKDSFDIDDFHDACRKLGFEKRKIWVELSNHIVVHLGDQSLVMSSPFHRNLFEHRVSIWEPYKNQSI